MTETTIQSKLHNLGQMFILTAISIFSLVLLIMNRIYSWESWMFFIILSGIVCCWTVYFLHGIDEKYKIYFYAMYFIFQLFYFSAKSSSLQDIVLILIIFLVLFVFTNSKTLVILTLVAGYAGLIYSLVKIITQPDFTITSEFIFRTCWYFITVYALFLISACIVKLWKSSLTVQQKEITTIVEENRRVNNFLANVSHEIRTPINAVLGLSSVLKEEKFSDEVQGHIQAISDAGGRIAQQISDILDFSEIDMKKITVNEEPYIITSLINDLLTMVKHRNDFKTQLVFDMEPNLPAEMLGDASKIKKILWHLIINGLKYTHKGGVYAHIFTIKRDYGVNLMVEISDTGCGIPEDEIDSIYQKFYQADSSETRKTGGLGLGLSIVNGFARAMNGFVSVKSKVDVGTTVRVSIPQKLIDKKPCLSVIDNEKLCIAGFLGFMTTDNPYVREYYSHLIDHLVTQLSLQFHRVTSREELERLDSQYRLTHLFVGTGEYIQNKDYIENLSKRLHVAVVADPGFSEHPSQNISLLSKPFYGVEIVNYLNTGHALSFEAEGKLLCPGVKALVVDDEPMNLFVAKGIFEKYGMNVTTVSSGFEAIESCAVHDYDIIFMDHMMPMMDGTEAMKKLRVQAADTNKTYAIIALTANATSSAKKMFIAEGFDGFVPKPIEKADLERVLKHVLPKSAIVYEEPSSENTIKKEESHVISAVETEKNTDDSLLLVIDRKVGLSYCQDDEVFYNSLLIEYSKDSKEKVQTIEDFYAHKDWKNYAIKVHAIKSTSKMIGALALSEQARILEAAAKNADEVEIVARHKTFVKAYSMILDTIDTKNNKNSQSAPPQTSDDDDILEFAPEGQ